LYWILTGPSVAVYRASQRALTKNVRNRHI
jgi:hypothetical protein